jgi:hypothetical protein
LKTNVFVELPTHTAVNSNQMTNLEKRHIKNTSLMLLENCAGPTSGMFCVQIIIEFTHNLYYGHYQAKESDVDQGNTQNKQHLMKYKLITFTINKNCSNWHWADKIGRS